MTIYATKVQNSFPPEASRIVTPTEVKQQLSLFDDDSFDSYIDRLITAAATHAGNYIGQSLEVKGVTEYFGCWDKRLVLNNRDIDNGTLSVAYLDTDNTNQTVASSDYILDESAEPASIVFPSVPTSSLSQDIAAPIIVTYETFHNTGFDDQAIKQAILIMIADMFNERESNPEGVITRRAHITAERLLAPYRRKWI